MHKTWSYVYAMRTQTGRHMVQPPISSLFFFSPAKEPTSPSWSWMHVLCVHSCPVRAHVHVRPCALLGERGLIGKFLSPSSLSQSSSSSRSRAPPHPLSGPGEWSPRSRFSTCSSSQGFAEDSQEKGLGFSWLQSEGNSEEEEGGGGGVRRRNQDHVCF